MSNEINILNYLYENTNSTQRDIAAHTGLSLGGVNILLKKMGQAGLIRIEQLSPKLVRYILTPEGIREKTAKTYRFIARNYRQILNAQHVISMLLDKLESDGYEQVVIDGERDEIYEILQYVIMGRKGSMKFVESGGWQIEEVAEKTAVLVWTEDRWEAAHDDGRKCVHLLREIKVEEM